MSEKPELHGLFDDPPPGTVDWQYAIVYDANPPNDAERDADHPVDPTRVDDDFRSCLACDGAIAERQDGWHHVVTYLKVIDLRDQQQRPGEL